MADVLSGEARRRLMQSIRGADTKPEMVVRKLIFRMGFRYRLHVRSLPGSPDLVFPGRRKLVFVHGCFWHRHRCRQGRSRPGTNIAFWHAKFAANVLRDRRQRRRLSRMGWKILIVWECETRGNLERLAKRLRHFLTGEN